MELTRENFRAMIYYDSRHGLSRKECINQLTSTFVNEAPFYATVKRWYNELYRSHHSLTDEFRKGRPKSVFGPEYIDAVQKRIMQNRYMIVKAQQDAKVDWSKQMLKKCSNACKSV